MALKNDCMCTVDFHSVMGSVCFVRAIKMAMNNMARAKLPTACSKGTEINCSGAFVPVAGSECGTGDIKHKTTQGVTWLPLPQSLCLQCSHPLQGEELERTKVNLITLPCFKGINLISGGPNEEVK